MLYKYYSFSEITQNIQEYELILSMTDLSCKNALKTKAEVFGAL